MNKHISDPTMAQQSWHPEEIVQQVPERERGIVQWWYRNTTPPGVPPNASHARREADRKAHLLSTVSFLFFLVLLLFLPASFLMPAVAPLAVLFAMGSTAIALVFNRAGRTTVGGAIVVLGAEIALTAAILLIRPFTPTDIQLYDLYILLILLAISLLPPRYIFLFAIAHSAFIGVDMFFHPHTLALAQDLQTQFLPAIVRPIGLQLLCSSVAYIWVSSAIRAIERADRAELVARLEHTIAEERALTAREKKELDDSIQQLVHAHIDAANGQLAGRIPYPPARALWPLIGAMNSLWARSQRNQQIEREYQQLQQAISHYIMLIQKSVNTPDQASLPLIHTGTSLDQLLLAVKAFYRSSR